jgi:hypothetical protein
VTVNEYQRSLWTPASVGCHWHHTKVNAAVSTYAIGKDSGYTAYYNCRALGNVATFERAVKLVNNAIALDFGLVV